MSSLDISQITELLKNQPAQGRQASKVESPHERPIQVGPVRYSDKPDRCASRGCGSTTCISINGVRRCSTHALDELNRLVLNVTGQSEILRLGDCNCKAGRFSYGRIHTSDCETFNHLSEVKDSVNADTDTGTTESLPGEL